MSLKYYVFNTLILCIMLTSSSKSDSKFKKSLCPDKVIERIQAPSVGTYHYVKRNETKLKSVVKFALKKIIGDDLYPFIVHDVKSAAAKIGQGTSYSIEFDYKYDIFTNGMKCCIMVEEKLRTYSKKLQDYECVPNQSARNKTLKIKKLLQV